MSRGYQYDYASINPGVFDREGRRRKAETMTAVLRDVIAAPLSGLSLLDVGGSGGAIDIVLSADEITRLEASYRPHAVKGHE